MRSNPQPYEAGSIKLLAVGTLAIATWTGAAPAAEHAFGVGYLAEHSSNIRQTPSDRQKEWIHSLIAGAGYQDNTPEWQARLLTQVERRKYQNNTYSDENLFFLDSSAIWTVSPQFFTWTVEDGYHTVLLDAAGTDTPTNRAASNVFSTGPDLILHFSAVHTLTLGGRYGKVHVGRSDLDNDRHTGYARWGYQSSPYTDWSLNYQTLSVDYDAGGLNADFKRQDAYFRLRTRPTRSEFTLDLGGTRIERESADDLTGSLGRLGWTRQLTSESSFGLAAAAEYQDTGTELLLDVTGAGVPALVTEPVRTIDVVSSDVYYSERHEVFYVSRGSVFGLNLRYYRRDLDFERTAQDRRETGRRADLSWFFSGASTLTLFHDFVRTDYWDLSRHDNGRTIGLRYDYRLTRTVSLGLDGRQIQRDSSDPALDFTDNRVLFTLLYSSGPAFVTQSRR